MRWWHYLLIGGGGYLLYKALTSSAQAAPPDAGPAPVEPGLEPVLVEPGPEPVPPSVVNLPKDEFGLMAWVKQLLCDDQAIINVVKESPGKGPSGELKTSYLLYWKLSTPLPDAGAGSVEGRWRTEVPLTGNVFTQLAQEILEMTKGEACGLRKLTGQTIVG